MRREAEQHAEEDRKFKEKVEARNTADSMAYQAEKALEDLGDKVPDDVRAQVEEKVAEVRKVLEDQDADAETINRVTEELTKVVQQIGAAAYQQEGPTAGPGGAGPDVQPPEGDEGSDDDDDVVEGEFRSA